MINKRTLERFPVRWNHLTDKKPLQSQTLERFSPVRHGPIPTKTALAVLLFGLALPATVVGTAAADEVLTVEFQETERADSFLITNAAPCMGVVIEEVSFTFETAEGALFFDALTGGEGYQDELSNRVSVYEGAQYFGSIAALQDGGKRLSVRLKDFETGASMRFGVDVDDRAEGPRQGTLDDANARELEGTAVGAYIVDPAGDERAELGRFGSDGHANVTSDFPCEAAEAG